jgi:hypothetical protein
MYEYMESDLCRVLIIVISEPTDLYASEHGEMWSHKVVLLSAIFYAFSSLRTYYPSH